MKNIKKILFSLILVCLSFCFSKNVLADTTCRYTVDYPFDDTFYDITNVDGNIIKYSYRRIYGQSSDSYYKYLTYHQNNHYVYDFWVGGKYSNEFLITERITLSFDFNEGKMKNQQLLYLHKGSNKPATVSSKYISLLEKPHSNECPDVFGFIHSDNFETVGMKFFYLAENENSLLNTVKEAYSSDYPYQESLLILLHDKHKVELGGIMYVNYAYNIYFNDVHPNDNIDPIVEKYLAIDGTREILDKINEILDKKNLSDSDISGHAESISEFIKKIDVSLDTIGNDIVILNSFNSVEVTGVKGIYNILRTYLDGKGLTVSDWFSKYMPDSKAQYADSLASILQYILDNPALYNSVKNKNNLSDAVSSCTGEDCDKEEICNEYVSSLASYECSEQTSISIAHNECYKSKMNNFDKLVKECKENDINQIKKDIEDLSKNIDKLVDETVTSYYTKYFKDVGIDIGDNDFCEVLKSGGIYEYIKLALNIIRIGGPILVILLTAYDGIKMIASFKDDENKKFYNHLKIRLICLVLLLLIPTIIKFIIDLFIEGACNIEDLL